MISIVKHLIQAYLKKKFLEVRSIFGKLFPNSTNIFVILQPSKNFLILRMIWLLLLLEKRATFFNTFIFLVLFYPKEKRINLRKDIFYFLPWQLLLNISINSTITQIYMNFSTIPKRRMKLQKKY